MLVYRNIEGLGSEGLGCRILGSKILKPNWREREGVRERGSVDRLRNISTA